MSSSFEFDWRAAIIKINQLHAQVRKDITGGRAQYDRRWHLMRSWIATATVGVNTARDA
jgi:hypothetical protein